MSRAFIRTSSEILTVEDPILTTLPICISCHFKTTYGLTDQELVSIGDSTTNDEAFALKFESTGDLVYASARHSGSTFSGKSDTSFSILNVWEHAGASFETSTSRYAIHQGVKGLEETNAAAVTGLDQAGIGARYRLSAGSNFFDGSLVDVAMWSAILTDAEWLALAAGVSPLLIRPEALVMYTPMIGAENTELIGGRIWAVTGTPTVDTNPRLIRPSAQILQFPSPPAGENNIAILPSTVLTLTPNAPQAVTTEKNIAVIAAAVILTLTPNVPQAISTEGEVAQLSSVTLTLTPNVPQAVTTEKHIAELPSTTLTLTPNVPQSITTEKHIAQLPSTALTLTPNVPQTVVTEDNFAQLPSTALMLTPFVPQAISTDNQIAELPSAPLTLTPNVPQSITTEKHIAQLPSASLTLTPNVPQAVVTEDNFAQLPSVSLTLTAFVPTVETFDPNTATLVSVTLTLAPNAPQAVTTEKNVVELPSTVLTLTPNVPQAIITEKNIAELPSVVLTLTPNVPQAVTSEGNFATLPSTTLTLTPFVTTVVATENNFVQLPSATLTLTPNVPQAVVTQTPVITDVDTDEDYDDAQTGVVVTGTGFEPIKGTGKVEISDNATYALGTKVEQSTTAWNDTSVTITGALGSLTPGPLWMWVTNDDGNRNIAGFVVTVHRAKAFALSASANIAPSGENTTGQLIPPTSGSFFGGRIQDDENPADAVDPGTDQYIEDEWSIEALPASGLGETYQFRVLINGVPQDTITVTPQLTIAIGEVALLPSTVLTLTPNALQAITTEKNIAQLPSVALTLTSNTPLAVSTDNNFAQLPSVALTLTPNVPTVVTTDGQIAQLPSTTLTLAPNAPTVETFDPNTVTLPSVGLTLTPNAPLAVTSDNHIAQLPSAILTLTPNVPLAITSDNQTAQLPSAVLTLTPFVPTVIFTGDELPSTNDPDVIDVTDPREFIDMTGTLTFIDVSDPHEFILIRS